MTEDRDRIREQIEEILERADVDVRDRRASGSGTGPPEPRRSGPVSLTGWLVITAVFLLVISVIFRSLFLPLVLVGVALLLLGYWLAIRGRTAIPARITTVSAEITPTRLMAGALASLVLGLILKRWFPYFGGLAFSLFLWAYWISWPKRGRRERRHRGQIIDLPESFWSKLKRWLRGR